LVRREGDCEEYLLLLSKASLRSISSAAEVCTIAETFENLENSFEILVPWDWPKGEEPSNERECDVGEIKGDIRFGEEPRLYPLAVL
tara:strand:+ start:437 stop:697 length:261 start_codon:yes stop_codon:yes gene_type:complete